MARLTLPCGSKDEFNSLMSAFADVLVQAGRGAPAVLQPLAGRLARRFGGSLALTFITALCQVRLYLEDEDTASQIRATFTGMIEAETRVVVAHSLNF